MSFGKSSGVLLLLLFISLGANIWQWQQSVQQSSHVVSIPEASITPINTVEATVSPAPASPSLPDLALQWFNTQQHEQAIQVLDWLEQSEPNQARAVFAQLMAELNRRLDGGDYVFVETALSHWLQVFPYDTALQLAFAKLCEQLKRFDEASNTYFDLADAAINDSERRRFIVQARDFSGQHLNLLSDNQRWDLVIEFIDQLIWREPDHIPHVINLAKAYIANGQAEQARIHLANVQHYPEYQQEAERLLAAITPQESEPAAAPRRRRASEIALQSFDNHFLVPLKINGRSQASLIIDTGASLTVLSRTSFERLNIARNAQFVSTARMNTAGGIASADIYLVSEMSVGRFVVKNERIAVMDLPGLSPSDGLLGMNFLGAFNFQIDTEAKTLSLARK